MENTTGPNSAPTPKKGWVGWSLIGGLILAVPTGWLLAYLAYLPLYLGLFFFMLLGLLIGALMFRFGRAAAPVSRKTLWLVGTIVALTVWGTGLVADYIELPSRAVNSTIDKLPRTVTPDERDHIYRETREHVAHYFDENYPPGGFIGYIRWVTTRGKLECPHVVAETSYTFHHKQWGIGWLFRVIVSGLLLLFGILSQFMGLAKPPAATGAPEETPAPTTPDPPKSD